MHLAVINLNTQNLFNVVLIFKLFPGQPGHPGHLRQLIMHFGSGGDVCFIVAMAVPFLESALLFVIVFSIHCMLFFQKI